jgi:hypothetical protein
MKKRCNLISVRQEYLVVRLVALEVARGAGGCQIRMSRLSLPDTSDNSSPPAPAEPSSADGGGNNNNNNNGSPHNPETPLEAARRYKAEGLSIIPLASKSKKPPAGYDLKKRLYDTPMSDEEITAEFEGKTKHDINVGVTTGRLPRLLTFDIDGEEGKKRFTYVIENVISPETREYIKDTYVVETGNHGYQVHFRFSTDDFPEGDPKLSRKIRNRQLWTPEKKEDLEKEDQHRQKEDDAANNTKEEKAEEENEIRLKGEGGYVVMPPSIHPDTGREYKFAKGNKFVSLSKDQFLEIREAVKAKDVDDFQYNRASNKVSAEDRYVVDYATGDIVEKRPKPASASSPEDSVLPEVLPPANKPLTEEQIMDVILYVKPYYKEPYRHDLSLYLGGWLRKKGVKYEHARKIMEGVSEDDPDPQERADRIRAVSDQYDKNTDGTDKSDRVDANGNQIVRYSTEIKGFKGLEEIFIKQLNGNRDSARRLLSEIDKLLPKTQRPKAESDKEREKRKKAERIPNAKDVIVKNCKEFFVDQHGVPHIAIKIGDHYEVMNIKEDKDDVKGWINHVYHADTKTKTEQRALELGFTLEEAKKMSRTVSMLNDRELTELYNWLRWEAKNSGVKRNLQIRISGVNSKVDPNSPITDDNDDDLIDTIYIDLTNDKWEVIKVTAEGWEIVQDPPILFKRGTNRPQVHPAASGDYDPNILDQFVSLINIRNSKHQNLFKKWYISLFWPATIPKPAPMPYGSWGSGKTFMFETVKDSVDPSSVKTMAFPNQAMEFIQLLDHEYLAFFDNMPEKLSESRSDAISRTITGHGFIKRTLYENKRIERYNFTRVVGFNGITLAARKADLLSRGLLFEIMPLKDEIHDPEGRQLKSILWRKYQRIKPKLLAYILDMLVKILRRRQQYTLEQFYGVNNIEKLPRLADWALFCAVVSEEMALTPQERESAAKEFIDNYYENINQQSKEAVEASTVAQCLIELMDAPEYKDPDSSEEPWWEGTASQLLPKLKEIAKTKEFETKGKSFPANPSSLGKKLRSIQASLQASHGIYIKFEDRPDHAARIICVICKEVLQKFLSTRRPVGNGQDSAQNEGDSADRKYDRKNGGEGSPVGKGKDPPDSGDTSSATMTGGSSVPSGLLSEQNTSNRAQNENLRQNDDTTGKSQNISAKKMHEKNVNADKKQSAITLVKEDSVTIDFEWDNRPGDDNSNSSLSRYYAQQNPMTANNQRYSNEGMKDCSNSSSICSFLQNYVVFDLEWINDKGTDNNNRTIYAAAFVDNCGNQKILHISDFGNSESALLQAITNEILKYPASIGWYTTGISRESHNRIGGVSAAS